MNFGAVIILAACLALSHGNRRKYCNLCMDHVLCKFWGVDENCRNLGSFGVTNNEKKEIVNLFNWFRETMVSATKGPPGVRNSTGLYWDEELAKIAQMWVDQCDPKLRACQEALSFPIGQIIHVDKESVRPSVNWSKALLSSFFGTEDFDRQSASSFGLDYSRGQFAKLIWHDAYAVGCGRRSFEKTQLYACEIGPIIRRNERPYYGVETPCSGCSARTGCKGLPCDKGRPENVKNQKQPILKENRKEACRILEELLKKLLGTCAYC